MRTMTKRRPIRRTASAVEKPFPAPIGGWNANDSLASMKLTDAVELVNWFPRTASVDMRPGSRLRLLGIPGTVKTLAVYNGLDGTNQMLWMTDQGVGDATFGGEVTNPTAATWAARTNGKHQWEMFGDGTNNWLIAVNGVDKPFYYNGATIVLVDGVTTPAITGITTTDIVSLGVFKERLLFIRNDKLGFDYLTAGAAGGAATYFDLASIATKGGYLMAIAVWTRDAGSGPDDYCVFITSEGEAIVYQGTDPSSATTWALVGTFQISRPLGRRCVLKYGADPIILTETGTFPLSSLLASGDERQKFALSYKIQRAFSDAATDAFSTFGWRMISHPTQNAIIVNVPKAEDGVHEQFVMNTITKAWCKFTGWDAEDFAVFDRQLYYCKGNRIYRAWDGTNEAGGVMTTDAGEPITYVARQAFSDFGVPSIKQPIMFMPVLTANRFITYATGIDTDFVSRGTAISTTEQTSTGGRWGSSLWGTARWAEQNSIIRNWGGTASWPGRWLAGKLKIVSSEVHAQWVGSVIRFEIGNGV